MGAELRRIAVERPVANYHTRTVAKRRKDIPVSRTRVDAGPSRPLHVCDHAGCERAAEYRAPRTPDDPGKYFWFCLEHVQAYNRSWDFFRNMSPEEIERYRVEAVTGHRPTWRLGERGLRFNPADPFSDPLGVFDNDGAHERGGRGNGRRVDPHRRKALAELELETTATLQEIKLRYKQLVKRYHPDANGGDKRAEERFKIINEAYNYLLTSSPS